MQGYPDIRFPTVWFLLELHLAKLQRSFEYLKQLRDEFEGFGRNFRLDEMVAFDEFFNVEFTITYMQEKSILNVPTVLHNKFNHMQSSSSVALKLVKIEETMHSYKMVVRIIS